ncbi:hypothetical protein CROQUDRAFT_88155 [Cronartium quercuum f. sp. fusiforme G11]|uniref:Uncharacterized protein n=1 Tax=Cronartium quercuum f. sp. fusiforme G11 TaxID=708437 RepID=A0A9P6NNE0_9BASI|nr:hypothetical protein CROQUDRAFT_88155 [Cronartium quercuum f. sp. fusiforme G11]
MNSHPGKETPSKMIEDGMDRSEERADIATRDVEGLDVDWPGIELNDKADECAKDEAENGKDQLILPTSLGEKGQAAAIFQLRSGHCPLRKSLH